jgi:hypothetical protein
MRRAAADRASASPLPAIHRSRSGYACGCRAIRAWRSGWLAVSSASLRGEVSAASTSVDGLVSVTTFPSPGGRSHDPDRSPSGGAGDRVSQAEIEPILSVRCAPGRQGGSASARRARHRADAGNMPPDRKSEDVRFDVHPRDIGYANRKSAIRASARVAGRRPDASRVAGSSARCSTVRSVDGHASGGKR